MKRSTYPIRFCRAAVPVLGLALFALGTPHAQASYKIDVIAREGDKIGENVIAQDGFVMGTLNDGGEIVCSTNLATIPPLGGESLLLFAKGKPVTTIFIAGQKTPGGDGTFALCTCMFVTVHMNQRGNVPFSARACSSLGSCVYDTYLWDRNTQTLKTIARKGLPAVNGLTFEAGGGWRPTINNSDEIAFTALVKNAAGQPRRGVFFLGRDNKLLPIAIPDQALPGGAVIDGAFFPNLNDQGMIAFVATRKGDKQPGAYLWENGTITPVAPVGMEVAAGQTITGVGGAWVNEKDRSVLIAASVRTNPGYLNLYRFADGKLSPVVVRGQQMPGGGQFDQVPGEGTEAVRYVTTGNASGQHAFLAILQSGTTGIFLLDPDGTMTPVLRSRADADTDSVNGISLNNKGQIATTVRISGKQTLVLLAPPSP